MTLTFVILIIGLLALLYEDSRAATSHRNPRVDVAQKLNRGLRGTPMQGTGYLLERIGRETGVHPAFIAGAAAFEGGFDLRRHTGKQPCLPYNPYGLGSCGRAWTPPTFRSWAHSIRWYARWLRSRWPHARTVYDFHGYCPPCGSYGWGLKVRAKMLQLGFATTSVRYP